ncbi:MAG: G5 domain-containing protein [Defluviitaleaceae bacterium]|nr:G5 domain-containing protein [Defluviitaleaceae bacterium]
MDDNKKPFQPPPTPIKTKLPDSLSKEIQPAKRGRASSAPHIVGMPRKQEPSEAPSEKKGLGAFKAAQRSYAKPRRKPSRRPRRAKINPKYLSYAGWSVITLIILVSVVRFISGLFVDNAFAVYLDGELMGYVQIDSELTSEHFHRQAVNALEARYGNVKVNVEQQVTIEPARTRSSAREPGSVVLSRISNEFTYTIAALAIYVNDSFEALLRTQIELDFVKDMLAERWCNDNTVEYDFVDGWEVRVQSVDPEETDFDTPDQAYWRLDRTEMQHTTYVAVSGDNLGRIAERFGTSVSRIMGDNNLTSTGIFVGDSLSIYTHLPLLSVRTFDEYPTMELVEMPVKEIENPELSITETRVVQEGQSGQQRVTVRVEYINGVEQSRTTLDPVVVIEPVDHIIERGTGAPTMERR